MSARLKGGVSMPPWHAIPFLKGLGMPNANPCQNGWPHLWRSCNWQKNTQLNHSMAPKEPYRESEWADVSPLLKYISGAVVPRLKARRGRIRRVHMIRQFNFCRWMLLIHKCMLNNFTKGARQKVLIGINIFWNRILQRIRMDEERDMIDSIIDDLIQQLPVSFVTDSYYNPSLFWWICL